MALAGLKGPIKSVKLFDDPKNPLHLDKPIAGYLGDTLSITDAAPDANNVLVITVDDQRPPMMPRFPQTTFSAVKILISYNKGPFSTAQTSTTVAYGGMPLILTGTVTFDPATKYDAAEVILAISEWQSPRRGLEYIVVQQSQNPIKPLPKENELRWFSTPIEVSEVSAPGAADVIPLPTGLGVQGPFGLQTPS